MEVPNPDLMSREQKVFFWGILAVGELQKMNFVECSFEITQAGTSWFDQFDVDFKPNDEELFAFVDSVPSKIGLNKKTLWELLLVYRDNRDVYYQHLEQEEGNE